MKRALYATLLITLAVTMYGCKQGGTSSEGARIGGIAEDLWGNPIDLDSAMKRTTLVVPFSPGDCGYCLLDGEFAASNYLDRNERFGGTSFHQCLFSPQLDIYAYVKHFHDTTSVLTFPQSLHDYHRDGFPAILGFRNGRQFLNDHYSNWEDDLPRLAAEFWPDKPTPKVILSSGRKMAENYMEESLGAEEIEVVPDGDTATYARLDAFARKSSGLVVKYEGDLKPEDMANNVLFFGSVDGFRFTMLANRDMPMTIDSTSVHLGPYTFSRAETCWRAEFPNPYNRQKYIAFHVFKGSRLVNEQWNDYCIWKYDSLSKKNEVLIDGDFAKGDDNEWRFADSLSVVYANLKDFCAGGVCPVPGYLTTPAEYHAYAPRLSRWTGNGPATITLGVANCRFPSIAVDPQNEAGVAWEENGDIIFALVPRNGEPHYTLIENGAPDSYNPRVVWDGTSFFVVYLSNKEIYYHLYGKYVDNGRPSEEMQLSGPGSFDVVTPALAADSNGDIVVAWSEWKANQRFPRYRMILTRLVGGPRDIPIVRSDIDYTNAWGINLAMDPAGRPWGSWNQHYPATITPCGGLLSGKATTPVNLTGNVETSERGEYPATAVDADGQQWLVWATYGREPYSGQTQRILVSHYDADGAAWSAPYTVSADDRVWCNQTPKIAVEDDGVVWVVWSGRPEDGSLPWGIYLTRYDGKWSAPTLISDKDVCSRAPEICLGLGNTLWVTWHAGTGEKMNVRVWTSDKKPSAS